MRDRLVELLKETRCEKDCEGFKNAETCKACTAYERYAESADHLLENGVIVPPVMSGQKVYLLRSLMNDVIEGEVTGLKTTEFSKYTVVFLIDDNRYTEIPFVAYGKTVFLTKEEAEQALKGGEG